MLSRFLIRAPPPGGSRWPRPHDDPPEDGRVCAAGYGPRSRWADARRAWRVAPTCLGGLARPCDAGRRPTVRATMPNGGGTLDLSRWARLFLAICSPRWVHVGRVHLLAAIGDDVAGDSPCSSDCRDGGPLPVCSGAAGRALADSGRKKTADRVCAGLAVVALPWRAHDRRPHDPWVSSASVCWRRRRLACPFHAAAELATARSAGGDFPELVAYRRPGNRTMLGGLLRPDRTAGLLLNAVSFIGVVRVLVAWHRTPPVVEPSPARTSAMLCGVLYLFNHPSCFSCAAVPSTSSGSRVLSLLAVLARTQLQASPDLRPPTRLPWVGWRDLRRLVPAVAQPWGPIVSPAVHVAAPPCSAPWRPAMAAPRLPLLVILGSSIVGSRGHDRRQAVLPTGSRRGVRVLLVFQVAR